MPKILFLTQTHNVWGGIECWLDAIVRRLGEQGWDVRVGLAKGARFNKPDEFSLAHPYERKPIILDASVGTETARVKSIIDAYDKTLPDIIVPVVLGAVFPAIRQLKSKGESVKLIVPVHSMHDQYIQNVIDNFDIIDHVVGVSRLIEQFFRRALPSAGSRIHYLRNGVTPAFARKKTSTGSLRIGFIGRLDNVSKRVLDLVPLCEYLSGTDQSIDLHIYGNGPEEGALKNHLPATSGSALNVTFHGYVSKSQLYETVYPALDVLMLFSPTEGSPLALYEAMHHGVVPVVSQFLGHASEGVIRPGQNGFTFPVGDLKLATKHLNNLASDPELLTKLSNQAIKDVAEYTEALTLNEWERLFAEAITLPAKLPRSKDLDVKLEPSGRLERWGIPAEVANRLRAALQRKYPHSCGFEEWPGTLPASSEALRNVNSILSAIEAEARSHIYTEAKTVALS